MNQVVKQTRHQVWDQIEDQVIDQVMNKVDEDVLDQVMKPLWSQTQILILNQIKYSLWRFH